MFVLTHKIDEIKQSEDAHAHVIEIDHTPEILINQEIIEKILTSEQNYYWSDY